MRVSIQIRAELREPRGQQAGRVRLRDAECRGDLGLAHVAEVAAAKDIALARMQPAQAAGDGDAVLARAEIVVRGGHVFGRQEHDRRLRLLPGRPDEGAAIAQMALDLADDRGRRVRGEVAACRLEAVDRLDQADRPDLDEILDPFPAVREAVRKGTCERQVRLDQLRASGEVALVAVRTVQRRGLRA